jgi:hypothetical protein
MAIKTFTTGEVLTASDTNTYLANSGLVYIKQQTVGSAVSSVAVSSAFSTDYDNYKIIWSGGTQSADTNLMLKLGTTASGYYGAYVYATYAGGGPLVAGDNNATQFTFAGGGASNSAGLNVDILNPFSSFRTRMSAFNIVYSTICGTYSGVLADTTSYTAFTLQPSSGTLTGGVVYVYGYRKA